MVVEQTEATWLAAALAALRFSSHEQKAASAVARNPGATAGEIAKRSQLHRNQVYRALKSLEEAGLLHSQQGRPQRFYISDGAKVQDRLVQALREHEAAARSILAFWQQAQGTQEHRIDICSSIPGDRLRAEVERFAARHIVASFDTWPLEYPPLIEAPRQITLAGRSAGPETRRLCAAPAIRYLLAKDACLLVEGPGDQPVAHLVESRAGLTLFQDHFERSWQAAGPRP